jgi:TetR/AcrR family transcriptional regulator, transcriptional repressor for nem operon
MARYDSQHKQQTRQRILDTAARRLKTDGIDGSGIATLMADAGLTNGAFYAHFKSKDDLVASTVAGELAAQRARLADLPPGRKGMEAFVREYLSPGHRDEPALGCPSAALLDEIARSANGPKDAYTAGAREIVDVIANHLSPQDPNRARPRAIGLFTLLVGTLQLSRALSDRKLSDEVLDAGIQNALAIMR